MAAGKFEASPPGLDPLTSALDYPMVIVTVSTGSEHAGCLVGFSTQCSIQPLRYAVCLSKRNRTSRLAEHAGVLAVHFPEQSQRGLAELFGSETGDEVDKFARCRWEPGPGGTPLLSECPNRFVGQVVQRVDAGDHVLYLLDVTEASVTDVPDPLTFQQVRDLEPGHGA